jgi:predicted transposase YbfD/YdcC
VDVGLLSAHSAIKVQREWIEKTTPENEHEHTRSFISSLSPDQATRLGRAARSHWSVENKNHHKRDHHVWQEDRHRHRRANIAQNLALTRNALLAIIPFDENNNLPSLIVDYQDRKQLAIHLILKAKPFP